VILDRLDIDAKDFERATGWEIKPEGACKGDVCVPLGDGTFDLKATADTLGMAVVGEPSLDLWAVGPEVVRGRALATVDASDFSLPDLEGNVVRITSLRDQKVLVISWAPY
jgi:hypothetical protein